MEFKVFKKLKQKTYFLTRLYKFTEAVDDDRKRYYHSRCNVNTDKFQHNSLYIKVYPNIQKLCLKFEYGSTINYTNKAYYKDIVDNTIDFYKEEEFIPWADNIINEFITSVIKGE